MRAGKNGAANLVRGLMVAAMFLLAGVTGGAAQDRRQTSVEALNEAERRVDRELTTTGNFSATFLAVREVYPAEYRRMIGKLAEDYVNGDVEGSGFEAAFQEVGALISRYSASIAEAPNADLVAFAERRREALRTARDADLKLCDDLAGDIFGISAQPQSRRTREAVGDLQAAMLRASKAGHDRPASRGPLAPEDTAALGVALAKTGATQRVLDQLLGDRNIETPRERCNVAIALQDAIVVMPGRQAAAVMANLILTRSKVGGAVANGSAAPAGPEKGGGVEAILAKSPQAELYAIMRAEFPDVYAKVGEEAMNLLNAGAGAEAAEQLAFDTYFTFVTHGAREIAHAGDRELLALLVARGDVLRMLRPDPAFCVEFADNYIYETPADAPARVNEVLMAYEAAVFRALAAGVKRPTSRAEPSRADLEAVIARLERSGLSEASIQGFLSGDLDDLPERNRCETALAVNDAIAALPPATAATLTARTIDALTARMPDIADEEAQAEAEEAPFADTPVGPLFDALEAAFPDTLLRVLKAAGKGGSDEASMERSAREMGEEFARFMRANARLLRSAPEGALASLAADHRDLFARMQQDGAEGCGQMVDTGLQLDADLSDETYERLAGVLASTVKAMQAGRDTPARRDSLSPADAAFLSRGLEDAGFTAAQAADPTRLSKRDMCRFGVAVYGLAASQPPDRAARLTSEFLVSAYEDR